MVEYKLTIIFFKNIKEPKKYFSIALAVNVKLILVFMYYYLVQI